VAVYIGRHFDAGVTQLIADIFQGLAILDKQRRKCVAQIGEPYPPQSRLLQTPEEHAVLDVVHVFRIPLTVTEDPLRNLILASGQPFFLSVALQAVQYGQQGILHIHPASLVRLGAMNAAAHDDVANRYELPGPVYVTSLKPGEFAGPRSALDRLAQLILFRH
jgi:hypothetical protein